MTRPELTAVALGWLAGAAAWMLTGELTALVPAVAVATAWIAAN